MLCQACNDLLNGKSARWKGSYKATFGLGGGSGQLASNESTTLDPEADPSDDADSYSSEGDDFDLSKSHGFVHHLSGRAFLAAADQGCRLCLLLVSRLSPKQRREIAREPEHVDTSSADYDYIVGCLLPKIPGGWEYAGCYNPRALHLKNGPISFELHFYASKSVLCPFPRPLTSN